LLSRWRGGRRSAAERARIEQELREANARILSLQQELAAHSLEADSATRELDALTYGISHDLRAPLRAIDGFARILEEDYAPSLGDEGLRHLHVIRDSAGKLERLIEGLLALSRVSRQRLSGVELDMTALARRAADDICRVRGIGQKALVVHDLPPARGDSTLLQQVWAHLLDNAFKFSAAAAVPRIEVAGQDENEHAVYVVKDNGAGFDMRYGSKLFNIFQRLHTEKEFPGVGAGLAIVHRIVSRHGGRVWAESEKNKGACFYFALPRDGEVRAKVS
jgi:light-regulated signal transduction histidine kinase (bacteriophytochrome)